MNRTSRVMRNHPYIGAEACNYLHEKQRENMSLLKMIWMVKMESGRASIQLFRIDLSMLSRRVGVQGFQVLLLWASSRSGITTK